MNEYPRNPIAITKVEVCPHNNPIAGARMMQTKGEETKSPQQIAKGLTRAQKDALLGKYSWSSPMEQEDGERELYRLGIWGPHGGRSPLGLAVRRILQETKDGE